jgi:hypothetical protein
MSSRIGKVGKRLPFQIAALSLFSVLFLLTAALSARAAPDADLWGRWTPHDDDAAFTIDHSAWTAFLRHYDRTDRQGVNRVAYGQVTEADAKKLQEYIGRLSMAPIATYSRRVQLAYWINLYNALTIRVVLTHYPVASIRDIDTSPGWFSDGPWGQKLVRIDGVELSLDDIEHRIVRPIWKDPRVHYALNCASVGCPNLQRIAYTGKTVERMLNRAARDFVNHPRAIRIDDHGLQISSIYKWFIKDFGGTSKTLLAHLGKYAAPDLQRRLAGVTKISSDSYDWSLNDDRARVLSSLGPRKESAAAVVR